MPRDIEIIDINRLIDSLESQFNRLDDYAEYQDERLDF